MAEKAGRKCPELIPPEVNTQVWYLWRWFCEISMGRQHNGTSSNPLAWEAIQAWALLTKRSPNEWEVATIRAIDWSYLNG